MRYKDKNFFFARFFRLETFKMILKYWYGKKSLYIWVIKKDCVEKIIFYEALKLNFFYICCRFNGGKIYTYIGEVCVSVNPYRSTNIYSPEHVSTYKGKSQIFFFSLKIFCDTTGSGPKILGCKLILRSWCFQKLTFIFVLLFLLFFL